MLFFLYTANNKYDIGIIGSEISRILNKSGVSISHGRTLISLFDALVHEFHQLDHKH